MAHNPKLNVYIISLKPKKQDENKTFRDFLKEKYAKESDLSDKACNFGVIGHVSEWMFGSIG